MAAYRLGVGYGLSGYEARHEHGIAQLDNIAGDCRLLIKLLDAVAHVVEIRFGSLEAALRPNDPHIVPHNGLDDREVVFDENGIEFLLLPGVNPVRNRGYKRVGDRPHRGGDRGAGPEPEVQTLEE